MVQIINVLDLSPHPDTIRGQELSSVDTKHMIWIYVEEIYKVHHRIFFKFSEETFISNQIQTSASATS